MRGGRPLLAAAAPRPRLSLGACGTDDAGGAKAPAPAAAT